MKRVAIVVALMLAGCEQPASIDAHALRLLDCTRLPADASNVRLHEENARDAIQFVRFDTNYAAARALAEKLTGKPPRRGEPLMPAPVTWWLDPVPPNAEAGAFEPVNGVERPGGGIGIVRQGDRATVWIAQFEHPGWKARPCDVKRFPFA